jgi:hypothetical protein
MPYLQAIVEKSNSALNRANIANVQREWFAPGRSLSTAVTQAADAVPVHVPGMQFTGTEQAFIDAMPKAIQETIREAIYQALGENLPIQVLWMPAYDFEVSVTSVPGTAESIGGVSILVKTRYASDMKIP